MKTFFISIGVAFVGAAFGQSFVNNEVLVKFRPGFEIAGDQFTLQIGGTIKSILPGIHVRRVRIPATFSLDRVLQVFRSLLFVEYVEPNFIARATLIPNDSFYGNQWALPKVNAPSAWDFTTGSASVIIAIIDTGVQLDHPDLQSKLVGGWNFVAGNNNPNDDNGHGTHCAGIAAAATNNAQGIAGLGWDCRIMPIKVLNSSGSGTYADVAAGMTYAVNNGAKVLSLSLAGSAPSSTLENAVNYAWNNGAVVVAAAGNNNSTTPEYPAWYANCIAVASSTTNDSRSSFSNYGSWVDVAAPGSSILSTYNNSGYATISGTSMAAPLVAGLAGLLWSYMGTGSPASSIRAQIENTAVAVPGNYVAYGRIDAGAALATAGVRNDFAPSSFTITSGVLTSGNVASLATADGNYLEIRNQTGSFPRQIDWFATALVSWTGTLQAIEIRYTGNLTTGGSTQMFIWNANTSSWESLGVVGLNSSDSTKVFVRQTSPTHYVSGGQVRFRMSRSSSDWPLFRMRTDRIVVTTVSQ